jgi:hypothetical protein
MTETLSKETRWFLSNEQVQPIKDWFLGLSQPKHFNVDEIYPRQDYYLIMPRVENLSIKIREPKKDASTGKIKTALEVKRLLSENEPLKLRNDNNGYSNKWQKLSFELAERNNDLLSINPLLSFSSDNWLRIDKDRILAKYDAEHNTIAGENGYPDEACGIELTKVKLNNSVYYSFGLEAFSKSGNKLDRNFARCCNYIFDQINITGLALESSLSYPEFLATII